VNRTTNFGTFAESLVNGTWIYNPLQYSRNQYPDAQELITLLNSPSQPDISVGDNYASAGQASMQHGFARDSRRLGIRSNTPFLNPREPAVRLNVNAIASHTASAPNQDSYRGKSAAISGQRNRILQTHEIGNQYWRPGSAHNPQTVQDRPQSGRGNTAPHPLENYASVHGLQVISVDKKKGFFAPGKVVKALWSQPGESDTSFVKPRRFIVIRRDAHHSVCLAIHTYGDRGTAPDRVRSQDHVVIYTGRVPNLEPGESSIVRRLVIQMERPREALRPASRVNVLKPYTIEHNIPVAKIGEISGHNVARLREYAGISIPPSSLGDVHYRRRS